VLQAGRQDARRDACTMATGIIFAENRAATSTRHPASNQHSAPREQPAPIIQHLVTTDMTITIEYCTM